MSRDSQHYDADFLVIGSGFGGSVSALRLAEKGYSVVVLEQGKRFASEDFPKTNRSIRRALWAPRLGFGGIQALTFFRHLMVLHGAGVGGGSLVYANTLVRPPDEVLDRGFGAGWSARLEPHYATAHRMLGGTRCPGGGRSDEMLAQVAREVPGAGPLVPHDVAVYFGEPGVEVADPFFGGEGPRRTGCTLCGACMIGCRVGAKNTLDKNYLWLAERRGVRIVPETTAVHVRAEEVGYSVETHPSFGWRRPRRTWRARRVVVAGGVVGSVRLLSESARSGGLPRLSKELGSHVRSNSEALLATEVDEDGVDFGDHVAITSGLTLADGTHVEMVRYNRGSDSMFWLAAPLRKWGLGAIVQWFRGLPPRGRAARSAIVLAMQSTEGRLRLVLRRGFFGLGPHRLVSRLPDGAVPPRARLPSAEALVHRMAERWNGTAWQSVWGALVDAPATAHILGGCRMAESPEQGVVDLQGRAHGHEGLYVVDGSVLPWNLGVNPSLTITAVAEYAMSHVPVAGDRATESGGDDS